MVALKYGRRQTPTIPCTVVQHPSVWACWTTVIPLQEQHWWGQTLHSAMVSHAALGKDIQVQRLFYNFLIVTLF